MRLFWQKIIRSFSNNSKFWWSLVILVGFSGVVIGSWRIIKSIKSPFQLADVSLEQDIEVKSELDKLLELRKKDSDQDGLSDYEELYIYNTSPYLEDTDSDGYLDKVEIESGNDPNCPAGENCLLQEEPDNIAPSIPLVPLGDFMGEGEGGILNPFQLDPTDLRKLLISEGADPEMLNAVDDEILQQLYEESIREFQEMNNQSLDDKNQEGDGGSNTLEVTPEQIRQELIKQGVDKELLDQLSDEELLQAYQEVINNME